MGVFGLPSRPECSLHLTWFLRCHRCFRPVGRRDQNDQCVIYYGVVYVLLILDMTSFVSSYPV
jgi:hypothetical protein